MEVAEKHDVVLALRKDLDDLKIQCRNANIMVQYRDDIITNLRKKVKPNIEVSELYCVTKSILDPNEKNFSILALDRISSLSRHSESLRQFDYKEIVRNLLRRLQ